MKIWERRLMKDFHVAPVEIPEQQEEGEGTTATGESALDRFRRVSKQVASQSATIKWNEVIMKATIEANSQIGRCRNRESFKQQQNLLKAMEQARKLIERTPMNHSPHHNENSYFIDQTSSTLVQLLKNISEEINEISPNNTLSVPKFRSRPMSPNLQSLNTQLQTLISKTPSVSPYQTKKPEKKHLTAPKPKPAPLYVKSPSPERILSPPPNTTKSPLTPKSPISPKSECATPGSAKAPVSIMRTRSPTPDGRKSIDDVKSVESDKNVTVKLIDFENTREGEDKTGKETLTPNDSTPPKVIKRKAPVVNQDISVSRPSVPKNCANGMLPPPPSKEETKHQLPIFSTTPATPLPSPKFLSECVTDAPMPVSPAITIAEVETMPAILEPTSEGSLENLVISSDPGLDANRAACSPPCLRVGSKVEDVKTIKRQTKTGWL